MMIVKLTIDEVNIILSTLAKGQWDIVNSVIEKIRFQAEEQLLPVPEPLPEPEVAQ